MTSEQILWRYAGASRMPHAFLCDEYYDKAFLPRAKIEENKLSLLSNSSDLYLNKYIEEKKLYALEIINLLESKGMNCGPQGHLISMNKDLFIKSLGGTNKRVRHLKLVDIYQDNIIENPQHFCFEYLGCKTLDDVKNHPARPQILAALIKACEDIPISVLSVQS